MVKQEGQYCYEYAGIFAGYNAEHVLAITMCNYNVLDIYLWLDQSILS
jgi:hypothetical protein